MERLGRALAAGHLVASACDGCGRRYLPPRPVCGDCRRRLSRWVPVADSGTLVAFTAIHLPIRDAGTGMPRPTPYGMGLIRLDGADTAVNHYVDATDPLLAPIGSYVRAIWRPDRRGDLTDILHFEVCGSRRHESFPPPGRNA